MTQLRAALPRSYLPPTKHVSANVCVVAKGIDTKSVCVWLLTNNCSLERIDGRNTWYSPLL